MRNWTIKQQLWFLSFLLLSVICAVGGIGYKGSHQLTVEINEAEEVYLPAIHKMTLIDMMHDGLRAVVFRALIVSGEQKVEESEAKEVASELKEMSESMNTYITQFESYPLDPKIKSAAAEDVALVKTYITGAEEIVGLALSGHRHAAMAKLPEFQKTFEELEGKLEVLGTMFENRAEEDKLDAQAKGNFYSRLTAIFVFGGLLGGLLICWLIVRSLNEKLSGIIESLSRAATEVSSASRHSSQTAEMLSESATKQAFGLQETMASAEEISAMVGQNADSAMRAKTAVERSESVSIQGSESVSEMLSAIDEIRRTNDEILGQMESSNREFGNIVKIISNIEDKTKVINDIVFQTKLLSFNASVEAARAGEHGKGFAVVAEEVGNLAQMSGNAAKEITDMLSGSVKRVNEIVDQTTRKVDSLVEIGKDKIAQGQASVQRCRDVLNQITEGAKMVSGMVAEISAASKEQAQGVSEINKSIGQLDHLTQKNSSVSQDSANQAKQLEAQAENLLESVAQLEAAVRGTSTISSSSMPSVADEGVEEEDVAEPLKKVA